MKKIILPLLLLLLLSSCNAYKKIAYVQSAGTPVDYSENDFTGIPEPVLQIGDLLSVTINTQTPEAAIPFNLPFIPSGETMNAYSISGSIASGGGGLQNYLIDTDGNISFPIIGKIHVAGLTKKKFTELIRSKIYPAYLKEVPVILVRFANYKISVLGEVARPGSIDVDNEKISILEALAQAGDLTVYGRRDNLLLIRENAKGERESFRIDLRDARLIDSPYFYLQQNDVLYVQPNNPKSRASEFSTAETVTISLVGTFISLTSLLINILK
ncbi:MAG: polysaccharide biosynthesis/export family protein [Paludibacter sp.]|nr:polysaccharide biosynthesis/export family protein [Paludibacter sp.]